MPSVTPLEKNQIFPSPAGTFLGSCGSESTSLILAGVLSGLNLRGSCACCHCLCEFICGPVPLNLEDAVSVESSATFRSEPLVCPHTYDTNPRSHCLRTETQALTFTYTSLQFHSQISTRSERVWKVRSGDKEVWEGERGTRRRTHDVPGWW